MTKARKFKEEILSLKAQGYESRYIGDTLGLGKSTVNDFLKSINFKTTKQSAKVLFLDIETSTTLAAVWKLWKENVGLEQIKEDWFIMSYAAKWLGEPNVIQEDCRTTMNDKGLTYSLHSLLSEADLVVCHNVKFDIPKIKARMVLNGLKPTKPFKTYCTLEAARRTFGFTSNKLAYLSAKLGTHVKSSHVKFQGFSLWAECLKGNEEAWNEMAMYNIDDIPSLEDVYLAIRAWDDKHPNLVVYDELTELRCPICTSNKLDNLGFAYTNTGMYNQFVCKSCGKHSRSRYTINTTKKRKSLLV